VRHPSARALPNKVDIYRFDKTRAGAFDADRTLSDPYPATPDATGVRCRVSLEYGALMDDMGRRSTSNNGLVVFGADHGLKLNDRIVWGNITLYVEGQTDMAGQGAAWGVPVSSRE